MHTSTRALTRLLARSLTGVVVSWPAFAGVPFVTDDPDTADKGHYEVNLGTQFTHRSGESGGSLLGIDVNYGVSQHVEAHIYAPLSFDRLSGGKTNIGVGDIELGLKYRFLDADDWGGWRPSIAIAPTISVPSGAESHSLGTGSVHAFIPVWLSKEFGEWTVFGGGGYAINPGPGNRNSVFTGVGTTYEINPKWTLGGEVFYASAAVKGDRGGTAFNLGGVYNFSDGYHLLFSAGRNLTNANEVNAFSSFVGIQLNF